MYHKNHYKVMEIEKLKKNLSVINSDLVRPIIENGIEAEERGLRENQNLSNAEIKQRVADATQFFQFILTGATRPEAGLIIDIDFIIKIVNTGIGMESTAFQANALLGNNASVSHDGVVESKVLCCFLMLSVISQ